MKFLKFGFLVLIVLISACNSSRQDFSSLEEGFVHPDDSLNPWCYYYWVADNVSKEGVTKDLESMAAKGITTAFIGNIGTVDQYQGDVKMLSEEWFDITVHAIKEAQRVGVDIGMFNSPGWSQSGGPWNKAENSMRYLAFSETNLDGPQSFNGKLEKPQHNLSHSFHYNLNVESEEDTTYEDVRVLAFRAPLKDNALIQQHSTGIRGQNIMNVGAVLDGNKETVAVFEDITNANDQVIIEITTDEIFEARSLKIHPQPVPVFMDMELLAEVDGSFTSVKKFKLERSNAMISVGFIPYAPLLVTFPAVKARKFKLVGTNFTILGGGIAELELSGAAGLEFYQEKLLAKMFQTPLPLWEEYKWEAQAEPENAALCVGEDSVIDITDFMTEDGLLNWEVPDGNWVVMRIGMYPTGTKNSPSSKEATGLEVDKMNKMHVRHHFNSYLKMFIDSIPENERKSFKHVVADSYEQGSQNWTDDMEVAFREKYNYDPIPYLPVLSGRLVESAEKSNRFLWDLRRLIADRVAYDYVGGLKEVSNEYGLEVWLENYGHWGFPAEFLQYGGQSDMVAGEFWAEGDLGSIECKAASSAAHIYGKNRVYAESYTSSGKAFERHPAMLKKRGDWSYIQGINHTVLTLFIHQPYEDKFPGMMEWYGSEINRFNTWYSQADTWIEYLKRCHFMLQQGDYVADVCYFIGEDAPAMTGTRVPELPDGYSYDYINAEAIMSAEVEDGKILVGKGMRFSIMVLPPLNTMTPELLLKISELVSEGAAVYGPAPEKSPSLKNYPESDQLVKELAEEMWKDKSGITDYGEGKVFRDIPLKDALNDLGIYKDVVTDNQNILWTHRKIKDGDIYFISNQSDQKLAINPGFRISEKQPELWNAVDGSTRKLPEYVMQDHHTFVPVSLEPWQSFFLVFKNRNQSLDGKNFPAPQKSVNIEGPWQVEFDSEMRGPSEKIFLEKLVDWKDHPNEKVKYYSGTATYQINFEVEELTDSQVFLDLGDVEVMAKVRVNGIDAGGAWTPPYKLDITDEIQEGSNKLEVEVVNLWVNRLIKDRDLEESERLTWLSLGYEIIDPEKSLSSSGLIGPVAIEFYSKCN